MEVHQEKGNEEVQTGETMKRERSSCPTHPDSTVGVFLLQFM
jgi:hypothetical protein